METPRAVLDVVERFDAHRHGNMVSLVQRMLDLHKRQQMAKTAPDRTILERQIAVSDVEIDRLVYKLYDVTSEETAIVEGGNA